MRCRRRRRGVVVVVVGNFRCRGVGFNHDRVDDFHWRPSRNQPGYEAAPMLQWIYVGSGIREVVLRSRPSWWRRGRRSLERTRTGTVLVVLPAQVMARLLPHGREGRGRPPVVMVELVVVSTRRAPPHGLLILHVRRVEPGVGVRDVVGRAGVDGGGATGVEIGVEDPAPRVTDGSLEGEENQDRPRHLHGRLVFAEHVRTGGPPRRRRRRRR